MASSFSIGILRKECEESPRGNMLHDFYFLKLFEGSTRRLDAWSLKGYQPPIS